MYGLCEGVLLSMAGLQAPTHILRDHMIKSQKIIDLLSWIDKSPEVWICLGTLIFLVLAGLSLVFK